MAQEGRPARLPAQRYDADAGPRGGSLLGQSAAEDPRLERRAVQAGRLPRRAGQRGAPLGVRRAGRCVDAVLRERRRLCGHRYDGGHLGDGGQLRADRKECAPLGRGRNRGGS